MFTDASVVCILNSFLKESHKQPVTRHHLPSSKNISNGQGSLGWFISRPLSPFMLSERSWLLLLIIRVLISLD